MSNSYSSDQHARTRLLLGDTAINTLLRASVAVFGAGGVGGAAIEALARGGVGGIDIFDGDSVAATNINRQLIAAHSTVGQSKAEVARGRVLDINPDCAVTAHNTFYSASNADDFPLDCYDYIIDAIDTVSSKLTLIRRAAAAKVPIICCMGAGNKLDATRFEVCDISQTSVCPLARVMRRELRALGITRLKVVYSKEQPLTPAPSGDGDAAAGSFPRRTTPGSVSWVPPVAGFILAGEVMRDLVNGICH